MHAYLATKAKTVRGRKMILSSAAMGEHPSSKLEDTVEFKVKQRRNNSITITPAIDSHGLRSAIGYLRRRWPNIACGPKELVSGQTK